MNDESERRTGWMEGEMKDMERGKRGGKVRDVRGSGGRESVGNKQKDQRAG